MQKKIFIFFLALAASVGSMSAGVVNGTCGDNLTWTLDTQTKTLTIEGSGDMTNNWNSTSNRAPWYIYKQYIVNVSLPEGLTSIGDFAFQDCSSLTSVTIPNSVTGIGGYAFNGCTGLTSVTIPNSVTSIENRAFYGCTGLTSVTIGNSVTKITYGTFENCTGLTSVTIPNSVTFIDEYAFGGCTGLTSVTIGNSVTRIGRHAFYFCRGLTSVTIPNSVTSIGSEAFSCCFNLTSLIIGSSVTSINSNAFYCDPQISNNLTSVTCLAATPPSGGSTSGINPSNCTLYVPATAVETYTNAIWWEDFNQILPIPAQNPLVRFVDWDGTTLSYAEVESGTAATAPANPSRDGYTFIGWDQEFSNVTEDMTITALYQINQYQIAVASNDDTFGSIDGENGTFDYLSEHTYTAVPSEGHYFVRWSDNETANPRTIVLTQDVALTAIFATYQYTITWQDENGNVLKTDEVAYGQTPAFDGTLPTKAATEEYTYEFAGWLPKIKPATKDICYTTFFERNKIETPKYTVNINGENCSLHISNEVPAGTTLQVEAVADECFEFQKWSDNNTDNPRTITVSEDANLTAEFNKITYTITGKADQQNGKVNIVVK